MWIAFIFQYLWDTKQRTVGIGDDKVCCELLSFFSIFGIQNNVRRIETSRPVVVNCFHFSVSLGYKTTNLAVFKRQNLLWIAFIFQYLWDTKQRWYIGLCFMVSCELLSFFSIFGIQNNSSSLSKWLSNVVNCFHFSVSLGYKTTELPTH